MNKELEDKIIAEVPADDSTSYGEKMFLYWLIRELKPETVVETGTHKGLTSLYLADALEQNGKGHLHTADPFEWGAGGNFSKFPELNNRISFYKEKGEKMIKKVQNIDFAFIDGYHEDYHVLAEWASLAPNLSDNAVVVFHDCWYSEKDEAGVNEAIEEIGLYTIWLPTKNAMRVYSKHPPNRTS